MLASLRVTATATTAGSAPGKMGYHDLSGVYQVFSSAKVSSSQIKRVCNSGVVDAYRCLRRSHTFLAEEMPTISLSIAMEEKTHAMQSSNINTHSTGLHVLVVDHDSTCLKIVERMLQACNYKVVAVSLAMEALDLVRTRNGGFDIILVELHMPVTNGLDLLTCIRNEFMLSVIVMSSDHKQEVVKKCLEKGASFYFTKPLSMADIETLWEFAILDKRAKMKANTECSVTGEKRDLCRKKPTIVWTEEYHLKFLQAIEKIGFQNATPSKILKAMSETGLSRAHIASHLQEWLEMQWRNRMVRDHRTTGWECPKVFQADLEEKEPEAEVVHQIESSNENDSL
ncbi:hypothetical protein NE237_015452 [Protea cynaroides]|uniref:Response regulatory domain-containing protein n=1 Tax=Protea cynaroides TaxID=273540 RepID=A0A9Q0KEA5_9MAGN|nr:hypothetical protein NE237_015452 [Protea cynaroides]